MSNLKIKDIETLEVLSFDDMEQVVGGMDCPGGGRGRRRGRSGKSVEIGTQAISGIIPVDDNPVIIGAEENGDIPLDVLGEEMGGFIDQPPSLDVPPPPHWGTSSNKYLIS